MVSNAPNDTEELDGEISSLLRFTDQIFVHVDSVIFFMYADIYELRNILKNNMHLCAIGWQR